MAEEAWIHVSSGEIVLEPRVSDLKVQGTVTFVTTPSRDFLFCVESQPRVLLQQVLPALPRLYEIGPSINRTRYICLGNLQIDATRGTIFQMMSHKNSVTESVKVFHAYSPVVTFDNDFHLAPQPETIGSNGLGFFSVRVEGGSIIMLNVERTCQIDSVMALDVGGAPPADIENPAVSLSRNDGKFVFYSTSDETSWLIGGELSGNCSARISLIPRVEVALDHKPAEVDLSHCVDLCHLLPQMTSGICCHSYLKVNVNRPVVAGFRG
jgi:hypothetical protein